MHMYLVSASKWLERLEELSKPDIIKCPNNCRRKFSGPGRKYHLKSHLLNECGLTVTCLICCREFGHVKSLRYHMAIVHKIVF